jgi:hypothetical protein
MVRRYTLRRFTLKHDSVQGDWVLKDQEGGEVRRFASKDDALKGGALEGALGKEGGTVRIQLASGVLDEERTFPRSKDAREHPG